MNDYIGPLGEVTCVAGESFAVSGVNGDIRPGGDHGVYVRDTRVLNRLEILIDGRPPLPLSGHGTGPAAAVFHAYAPLAGGSPDPTLLLQRHRHVAGVLHEKITVSNRGRQPVTVELAVRCGTDFAYIFDVRHGRTLDDAPAQPTSDGVRFVRAGGVDRVEVATRPAPTSTVGGTLTYALEVPPGRDTAIVIDLTATDVYGTISTTDRPAVDQWAHRRRGEVATDRLRVRCDHPEAARLIQTSLSDLEALKMADPQAPDDRFCAAGSPWYLTLFGRDSLWTAFMAAPFDLDLAAGTLRVLARRQGTRDDPDTEESPGKILHEIRRGSLVHRGDLPPNYYGTIDATPLFVILANEAWRWGLPVSEVESLLPHVEAALDWIDRAVARSNDGFLSYLKASDRGLDNQGWKDSSDGIQFADGRLARPPIALVEVQGYAYDAALRGAELLDRFARPGADRWRRWANDLATRFHAAFWIDDRHGRYPAVALDRDHQPVDGPASNMGHLLATGILNADEAALVAAQLTHPQLASGFGLRTMATSNRGFNPLAYHGGSVWPHDTAIAVWGLAVSGQHDAAVALLQALVDAAPTFGYRLPELFGGFDRADTDPVPYPAACRPQAWAAGGALLLLRACLGLTPHIPDGRLTIAPLWPPPFSWLEADRLPIAGREVTIRMDAERGVDAQVDGDHLTIDVVTSGS
jgi:glycogen debranching enzyme